MPSPRTFARFFLRVGCAKATSLSTPCAAMDSCTIWFATSSGHLFWQGRERCGRKKSKPSLRPATVLPPDRQLQPAACFWSASNTMKPSSAAKLTCDRYPLHLFESPEGSGSQPEAVLHFSCRCRPTFKLPSLALLRSL